MAFLNRTDGTVADKTIRSGVWVTFAEVAREILRFAGSVALARLLIPEHFGLMGIVLFFLNTLDVFSQPGLSAAIIYRTDRVEAAVDVAWTALIIRGLLLSALALALAPFVAEFYGEPKLTDVIRVSCCMMAIRGFGNSHLITLRKEMDFKRLTIFEVMTAVAELVAVVSVAFVYRTVWALVLGRIIRTFASIVISYLVVPARPKLSFDSGLFWELFRYGKFITGAVAVTFLGKSIDKALIGKVLGLDALGYYVLAFALANLPTGQIAPIVTRVLFPAFSKLQNRLTDLRRTYLRLIRMVGVVTFPMAAGMATIAHETVVTVYGEKWLPMVGALSVLCLYGVLQGLTAVTKPVFNAIGKPNVSFYMLCLRLGLILALIYPLTVRYGIIGTAWAVTVPTCVEQLILWTLVRRMLGGSSGLIVKHLAPSVGATILMSAAILLLKSGLAGASSIVVLVSCVLLGVVLYSVMILLLDREFVADSRSYLAKIFAANH